MQNSRTGTVITPYPYAEKILSWYADNQRDLPWRNTRNPYRIWVSEIMLQQTQVETVIPFYLRFLSRFPTVKVLASASQDEVLKVWENLGYYARARNLHAAAKAVVERHRGKIPNSREKLRDLPGIGEYTTGAILSMAFDQTVPAVDANVRRIISRLFAIDTPSHQYQTEQRIGNLATKLVPTKGAGRFNQGLMDLGAVICKAKRPDCTPCPVQERCEAYRCQLQDALPVRKTRPSIPHHHVTAAVIKDAERRILIIKRQENGLLGGLWKFPGGRQQPGERLETSLRREVRKELGIQIRVEKPVTSVKHAYTHFRITLHAFNCVLRTGNPKSLHCDAWRWTPKGHLKDFAISKADRKIIQAL